jgi:hypothetical protein
MRKTILNVFYPPPKPLRDMIEADAGRVFVPVNGGSGLRGDPWCDGHLYFDDDVEGDISRLNGKLNEMTSIWWFWKSMARFGFPDYVGFNHYRRFFKEEDLADYEKYDLVVGQPVWPCPYTLEQQYQIYHVVSDLEACYGALAETDAYSAMEFREYMKTRNVNFAPCNMFLMKRPLFEKWCGFAFPVLFRLEKSLDLSGRDGYQARALCFLCERLFGFWCLGRVNAGAVLKEVKIDEKLDFKDNDLNERARR